MFPTLLTIICDNDGAKHAIGKEFDLKVRIVFASLIGIFDAFTFVIRVSNSN